MIERRTAKSGLNLKTIPCRNEGLIQSLLLTRMKNRVLVVAYGERVW